MRKRFTSRAYQTVQRRARAAQAGFHAGLIAHFDAQDGSSWAKGPPQSPAGPRSQPDPTKDTTATKIGQQRPMLAFPSGLRVLLVDGPAVRNHLDPDFCIGGHDLVYPDMIPAGEIWLERPGSAGPEAAVDLLGSLVHELAERAMMLHKGLTYERAHKAALALEADLRWQCNQARVHATCEKQFDAEGGPDDVLAALKAAGHEVLTAKGGFFIRGKGFVTLAQARKMTGVTAKPRGPRMVQAPWGDAAWIKMLNTPRKEKP